MTTKNLYHRRLVDTSHAKACWVCYKSSATVLITPDSDDWFHICASHLTDRNFATAKDAEDLAKKARELEIEAEIESLKKEHEEKIRKKLEKRKAAKKDKSKDKDKDKDKDKKADEKAQDTQDDKEQQEKLAELEKKKEAEKPAIDGPRVFELSKNFFNMRMQKKRDIETAKRDRARLRNPTTFPSVPGGNP